MSFAPARHCISIHPSAGKCAVSFKPTNKQTRRATKKKNRPREAKPLAAHPKSPENLARMIPTHRRHPGGMGQSAAYGKSCCFLVLALPVNSQLGKHADGGLQTHFKHSSKTINRSAATWKCFLLLHCHRRRRATASSVDPILYSSSPASATAKTTSGLGVMEVRKNFSPFVESPSTRSPSSLSGSRMRCQFSRDENVLMVQIQWSSEWLFKAAEDITRWKGMFQFAYDKID